MIIEATADGRKVMIETDRIQYIANNDGKADVKGDDFILRFDDYGEIKKQVMREYNTAIEKLEQAETRIRNFIRAYYNEAFANKNKYEGLSKARCDGESAACEVIVRMVTSTFRELKE